MEITSKSELDDFSNLNVLIIDDNRLVHDFLKHTFFNLGFKTVRCAENAHHGLALCEETRFHIIICSFNVKSDKDGFHLLEELKFKGHVNKTTILIFLSTETNESLVNSIVELQPDDFWVKPLLPKTVIARIQYTLDIKKHLFNLYKAIDLKEPSKVIYYAERFLLDKALAKYHPNIQRMKGEALINLLEYKEAEVFFKELQSKYRYAWVYLGYVKALLKQGKMAQIEDLLVELSNKPDTRFALHDLLAQYYMEQENYELAYEEIKKATKLSPRNIERNRKSWDLARLNHDHMGQYIATKNIAINAKNSIHDSPALILNVIRSGIDLACAITDESSNKVLSETDQFIRKLEHEYKEINQFREQITVVKARLHNVRNENAKAKKLVEMHLSLKPTESVEDNLDKVKVFHELGMREEAFTLLKAVKNQVSGDSLTSEVLSKYVEQETDERSEINFTPKQLNSMAVEFFQKNKLLPALNSVIQALKLAPKNVKLLFSLLKILIVMKKREEITPEQTKLAIDAIEKLEKTPLDDNKLHVFSDLKIKWHNK
ncbi:response regulator [Colwellia sp. UCD-KL20]|uniref:response regulator n=1 Tax=Colwellia sp. UCD-KL20 TaxID=1917165 RepID=UPI0009704DF9|nr:response regulator [Colwellia sp. UCD-KL20]